MFKQLFVFFLIYSQAAFGQLLLVRAGNILDVSRGVWNKDQTFLVRDGRIMEMNPKSIPAKTLELDLSDKFLIPGLIDAHTHLFLDDPTFGKNFAKGLLEFYLKNSIDERIELASRRSHSLLKSGFTAVRDLGNSGSDINPKLKKSDLRFFSTGPGHTPRLGQFPLGTSESVVFDEYARLDQAAFNSFKKGSRTTLKLYADEDPNPTLTDSKLLKQWVLQARKVGLKIAIHASLKSSIQSSIDAGADSIEHGTQATVEQFKLMAAKKIFWVPSTGPQVLTNDKFKKLRSDHIPHELKIICKKIPEAHKLGVRIVFGSDFYYSIEKMGVSFGEATIEALLYLQQCGLSPLEMIRSATLYSSELLGVQEIGRLERGSWADFVVLKDDPLTDIASLKRPLGVYLSGQKSH